LVERQTPVLFVPDVDAHVPPGIEISPSMEMLKWENCKKVFVQTTNHTAHDITIKGRTLLGTLQLVRSITPVEAKRKNRVQDKQFRAQKPYQVVRMRAKIHKRV